MPLSDMGKLILSASLLVVAGVLYWWFSTPPRSPFKDVAYAYLPEGEVTTDMSHFIYISGNINQASKVTLPDGRTGYPACFHSDPKVVPLQGGKMLYFPVEFGHDGIVNTPPLPPHQRSLSLDDSQGLQRYVSEEAKQLIQKTLGSGGTP